MRQSPRLAARMPDIERGEVLNVAFVVAFWLRRRQEPPGLAFCHVPEEFPGNPLLKGLDVPHFINYIKHFVKDEL